MTSSSKKSFVPHRGILMVLGSAVLVSACVVEQPVYRPPPPPPRVVYSPPPVYAAPDEGEVRATEAPPPLPDYEQPPCPQDGYLWTPGYWHWTGSDYYWVPGTWVEPPLVGVLWTPGYWGYVGGGYGWHVGYWGPHVGFYGGVNYGFGYGGVGYGGGRWAGNSFAYNTSVVNVNTTVIHNTYNQTVVNNVTNNNVTNNNVTNNVTVNKVSYNGGAGGVAATPTPQERVAAQETHVPATAMQRQHVQEAVRNPALAARANGGHPPIAATPRPAAFNAPGVVGARGAAMTPRAAAASMPNSPSAAHPPIPAAQPNAARPGSAGQPNTVRPQGQVAAARGAPKAQPPRKPQLADKKHQEEGGGNRSR